MMKVKAFFMGGPIDGHVVKQRAKELRLEYECEVSRSGQRHLYFLDADRGEYRYFYQGARACAGR